MSMAGNVYLVGAILLSAFVLYTAMQAAAMRTMVQARRVLLASIIYLPVIYGLLAFDS
jgi:protoheme IX farnesyltransferase